LLQVQHMTISRKFRVFHNFIRPHMGLEGKTPAEAAGIKVEGDNKWLTLMQNAVGSSRHEGTKD
jgi:hypothetical protein